jgi:hypothetical protein
MNDTKAASASKSLSASADKEDGGAEEDEDAEINGDALENMDEAELGEDPFARAEAPTGLEGGDEAWLKSDRDYTYPEVSSQYLINIEESDDIIPHPSTLLAPLVAIILASLAIPCSLRSPLYRSLRSPLYASLRSSSLARSARN